MPIEEWTDSRLKRMLDRCEMIIRVIQERRARQQKISQRIEGLYCRASNSKQWVAWEIHKREQEEIAFVQRVKKSTKTNKNTPERHREAFRRKQSDRLKLAVELLHHRFDPPVKRQKYSIFDTFKCDECHKVSALEHCRIKRNIETHAPEGLFCCECFYTVVDAWHLCDSPYRKIGKRKRAVTPDSLDLDQWFIKEMRNRDGRLGFFGYSYSKLSRQRDHRSRSNV